MSPSKESNYSRIDNTDADLETDGQSVYVEDIHSCIIQGQTTRGSVVTSPSDDASFVMHGYSEANLNTEIVTTDSLSRLDLQDLGNVLSKLNIEEKLEMHSNTCTSQKRFKSTVKVPENCNLNTAHNLNQKYLSMRIRNVKHVSRDQVEVLNEMVSVIFALEAERDLLFSPDCDGDTKLHLVIIFLLENVAMTIIDSVNDYSMLDMQNKLFQTPLMLAVLLDMPKLARRLMSCGVEIDLRDYTGNTALHIACRKRNTKMAELLMTPIRHEEVTKNKSEIPYRRIPQDLSIRNFEGETCVEIAFKNKDIELFDLLLDNGANVDKRCLKTGRTLLYKACLTGDIDIVKYLIRKTCNINMRAYDGSTPFDAARASGHWQIAAILAERGAESDSDSDEA